MFANWYTTCGKPLGFEIERYQDTSDLQLAFTDKVRRMSPLAIGKKRSRSINKKRRCRITQDNQK